MNPVIRAYEAKIDDVNGAERSVVAKISTQDIDRYNTVFLSRGCDTTAYNKNRVVLWCHGKDPQRGERPIGKNQWVRVDRGSDPKIIAKTIFNNDEFSEQLFRDYQNGFLNAWSISALPTDFGRPTQDEVRSYPSWSKVDTVYRQYDILEYSACGVPGNSSCTSINENEVRDLSEMVTRGYYIFPEVRYLVDQMNDGDSSTEDVKELVDPIVEEMTETAAEVDRTLTTEDLREIDEVAVGAAVETPAEVVEEVTRSTDEEVVAEAVVEIEVVVERTIPDPEPVVAPEAAPDPIVEAKPELPPLVGRSFDEIVKEAVKSIDDWQNANTQRIQDLAGWLRGEA